MHYEEDYEYLVNELVAAMLTNGNYLSIQLYDEIDQDPHHTWYSLRASVDSVEYTVAGADIRDVSPVPEPSTLLLLGAGVIGLSGVCRRYKQI